LSPIQVPTFEDFKEQVHHFSIKTVHCFFNVKAIKGIEDQPVGMKLYFYYNGDDHYLIDYAVGEKLKLTGIPIKVYGRKKEPYISEEDVKAFINKKLPGVTVSFDFEI
jgi:hypothetical protein